MRICVFCGSNPGLKPLYLEEAVALGHTLVNHGYELVYGGGNVGLMGAVADAVLAKGGRVVGVMPEGLVKREAAHQGLTELHIVDSMHERKAKMAELSDAFITLPGGFGTFEELFEVITWNQLGIYNKHCVVLDSSGFYAGLRTFIEYAHAEGFIRNEAMAMLTFSASINEAFNIIQQPRPQNHPRWLSRQQT